MSATDYAISKQLTTNAGQNPTFEKDAKKLYHKVTDAAAIRQKQADSLRSHIDKCPYPVIVCGDFNDTPAGYCYNTIARHLEDAFRRSGKGSGATYHGNNMPKYRIDYILHSPCYLSYGYTVGKEMDISDHYPITTTISLLKKK
jgi:endonuclease/exonuclease/phosphatase family metal-dependent hydrolase